MGSVDMGNSAGGSAPGDGTGAAGQTAPRGRWPLHSRILLGLALGVAAGLAANLVLGGDDWRVVWAVRHVTEPVGQLFLRLLLMTVIPLVFSSLICGVAGMGSLRELGRVGVKTLGYTLVFSALSVAIGIFLVTAIAPGRRVPPAVSEQLRERYGADAQKRVAAAKESGRDDSPLMQAVKTLVPTNPVASVAGETPNMLHLMIFALFIGVAAALAPRGRTESFLSVLEGVYAVSAKLIDLIMAAAPFAVACLLFNNVARFGLDLLWALGWYIVTVLVGLAIHLFGSYSLSVRLLAKLSPLDFFRRVKTAMLTAFSTSSSSATLPTALRVGEENLGVPPAINSFVLTVGATANQNGTALYEGVTVLFLAQLAGVDLSVGQQVTVAYMAILGGVGTAGVPSGSIPFVIVVLTSIGVGPELIAIILGVDRILDMCRTTLNVTGDLAAAAYVARSEGHELVPKGLERSARGPSAAQANTQA